MNDPRAEASRPVLSPWARSWRRYRRHKAALISTFVLLLIVAAVAVGPVFWTTAPSDIDFAARLQGPGQAHPLGTDDLGQDLLARMLYGGRISLGVGLAAMLVSVVIGVGVGALAAMARGYVGVALMWVTDLFLALPQLPLLLLVLYLFKDRLASHFGQELGIFILVASVLGGFRWMTVARLTRAQFLSIKAKDFVEAAKAIGASETRLVARHILPSAASPLIVAATINVAEAIVAESTLSFLGLGFPSDVPTWGRLLFDSKDYLDVAAYWALSAGGIIFITVLCINFIGDGLRDALDPREIRA